MTTVISVLAVMVGVMTLVVVLSVMNGFRAEFMSKIMGVNAHLIILNGRGSFKDHEKVAEIAANVRGVIDATPYIYGMGVVNNSGNVSDLVLRGIDVGSVSKVLSIDSMIQRGSLASLGDRHDGLPCIILGSELSKKIKTTPGDILKVITSSGKMIKTREYKITAIFNSGMYDFDVRMGFISLKEAQDLFGLGQRVSGLEIKVGDVSKSDIIARNIQEKLGKPFWTRDWKDMNRNFFIMLKQQKAVFFVILTMIVLIGALNIISTLVMVVMEKTKDIAILRAMGASARSIMSVFILQGLLVGIVGTLVGLSSGILICHLLTRYQFITLPGDVYSISTLPVRVESVDVLFVSLVALLTSLVASIYPAWHASNQNPAEAIRYE